MTFFHLTFIACLQGITEFLPISSSGHLALLPLLTGLPDQSLTIDIAAHTGSLGAVIVYFWRDVSRALSGIIDLLHRSHRHSPNARLMVCLITATIPVVLAGAVIKLLAIDDLLRNLYVIAVAMIVFGVILYKADQSQPLSKSTSEWNLRDAVRLGLWQILALIPGASRSGVTMTGARMCGYSRRDSARLSMLMSIPVIAAATLLALAEIAHSGDALALREAGIVATLSFVFAYASVTIMMAILQRFSFTPFIIYRLILGFGLLLFAAL